MTKRKLQKSPFFLLDSFSIEDLDRWEKQKEKILRYHWDLYSALAYERNKIADKLYTALLEATERTYEFSGWQRQVRYKYSLTPLSPKGSLIEPGGRFNIPAINVDRLIPSFPALYIAENKETVLQEAGQHQIATPKLSALDLALVKKDSITIVAVQGKLDLIIDLTRPHKLKPFLNLIKKFCIPKHIIREAMNLGLDPTPVQTIKALMDSLLEPDWRGWCMLFDIPANYQIFGQMVANAGITAVLYPSKFTKRKCLAIYPQNFDTDSFIAVEGDSPQGTQSKLDAESWKTLKVTL